MIGPGIARISGNQIAGSPATLQVDVFADLVCPWCYLGKRRLDAALSAVHGPSLVTWYPYQLNPDMPADGMPLKEYLASRFGDAEALAPAMAELGAVGRAEGIDFHFDRIERVPNTSNAHRLMALAEQHGVEPSQLAESLYQAFFSRGLDISDPEVLAELGGNHGLGRLEVIAALEDDTLQKLVVSREAQLRQSGVSAVPGFLVNKRLFVVGAQRTDNLVAVFDRAMFGEDSDMPIWPTLH